MKRDLYSLPDASVSGSVKSDGRNLGKGFRPSDQPRYIPKDSQMAIQFHTSRQVSAQGARRNRMVL